MTDDATDPFDDRVEAVDDGAHPGGEGVQPGDEGVHPGGDGLRAGEDEILTGEIVLRDTAARPSTEIEPATRGAESWLVDEALVPARPPITSHRRNPGITVPLILAAVVIIAGAVAWVAVGHMGAGVPPVSLGSPRTVDIGVPGNAGTPSPSATSTVSRSTAPPVSRRPRSSTPAAPASPTTATPSVASAPPSTAGTPLAPLETNAPTPVATPADGMVVRVVSLTSGQSMSVASNSTDDGAGIVQSAATTKVEQWKLVAVMPNCFALINQGTGKALDDPGGGLSNGTPMQQWSYGIGNVNQIWCLRSLDGDGKFSIQSLRSGSLLDLRDGGANGGVIQQWSGNPRRPDDDQTWVLLAVT